MHHDRATAGGRARRRGGVLCAAAALLLAAVTWAAATWAAPGAAAEPVTLLAAGDMRGEIKPCGCSPEGQMGGLPRRLTYLRERLAGGGPAPVVADLGNNFPEPSPQGDLKIELIQTLLAHTPPDAILPGPNELAYGLERLADDLPYVVSNERGGVFAARRGMARGGRRIGLYGYLSPELVYQGPQVRYRLEPAGEALLARLRRRIAAAGDDLAVLLFRGSDAELARFAASGVFEAIVAGNPSSDELNQVTGRPVDGATVPQVPTKGQGFVRLALGGADTAGADGGAAVDWLTGRYGDHPAAVAAFEDYDAAVKQLFFARLERAERRKAESPYAGAAACQACHGAAHETWRESRHAHAVATLERVGKQFDPECLACHVVGLERGGFLSPELTPHLANVQCENCHGPGKAHAADPQTAPGPVPAAGGATPERPGEATCRTCHRGSHSPNFRFDTYWPKIRHGRGGG